MASTICHGNVSVLNKQTLEQAHVERLYLGNPASIMVWAGGILVCVYREGKRANISPSSTSGDERAADRVSSACTALVASLNNCCISIDQI